MGSTLTVDNIVGSTTAANVHMPGGLVQVLHNSYSTQVTMSQGVWTDIGLSITITPKFSTSKVLVFYYPHYRIQASSNDTGIGFRLLRDTTVLFQDATTYQQYTYGGSGANSEWRGTAAHMYFDSPATTNSIVYKIQGNAYSGSVTTQNANNTSRITVMEIAQ